MDAAPIKQLRYYETAGQQTAARRPRKRWMSCLSASTAHLQLNRTRTHRDARGNALLYVHMHVDGKYKKSECAGPSYAKYKQSHRLPSVRYCD